MSIKHFTLGWLKMNNIKWGCCRKKNSVDNLIFFFSKKNEPSLGFLGLKVEKDSLIQREIVQGQALCRYQVTPGSSVSSPNPKFQDWGAQNPPENKPHCFIKRLKSPEGKFRTGHSHWYHILILILPTAPVSTSLGEGPEGPASDLI